MVQVSPSELIGHAWASEYIAVDTEGTDIHKTDLRNGTGYAYGKGIACRPVGSSIIYSAYFPIKHTRDNVESEMVSAAKLLVEKHKRVVYHNSKHDILALKTLDTIRNFDFYCTMQMAHWLYEQYTWSGFGLDWCAKFFLKDEGKKKSELFKAYLTLFGWHPDFPQDEMGIYCSYDAEMTLRLFEFLYRDFKKQGFDG